jgi:hypothetical protein
MEIKECPICYKMITLPVPKSFLGWKIWSSILERLIGRNTISRRDRALVEELYHFFNGIKPNPDYYWGC